MSQATILQTFEQRVAELGDRIAFTEFEGASYTWRAWHDQARRFASALIDAGVAPGEVVSILAGNNAVWPIADIGALMAGCTTVGIYPTSPASQAHEVLNDCGARVLVVDSAEQLAKALEIRFALPNLRCIIALAPSTEPGVFAWQEWLQRGADAAARVKPELDHRIADASPDDIAILIYTSGSTGVPKGARISHRYLSASANVIQETLQLTARDSTLSFLPFCHAAERIFGLYTRIQAGMRAMMIADMARLWDAARAAEPTLFGGLPRFYEKIYEALQARYAALPSDERVMWDDALNLGRRRSMVMRAGQSVPAITEQQWMAATAPARAAIAEMIGSHVRIASSGGATLPEQVAETLAALGLTVLGAYGMTEHLCVSMHRPDSYNFRSVGKPMPGTTIRVGENGEILIKRSALTFSGYQNKPADTIAAFTEDGQWLRTGDLGHIDAEGHLHITGREKELIALSGGKKVAPLPIERKLMESAWISQAVLFGESRKYISALLCLRREYVEDWARMRGLGSWGPELLQKSDLLDRIQLEIDAVNAQLSRPEQIRRFALLPDELSPERDELTPTMKVKRTVVETRYRAQLDALYGNA